MRTTRHTVTVHDSQYDSTIRLSLGEPHYGSVDGGLASDTEIGTCVFSRALWIGRRHVVLLTYSQWTRRDGTCTGDTYRRCDAEDVDTIRRLYGADAAERALDALRVPVTESL